MNLKKIQTQDYWQSYLKMQNNWKSKKLNNVFTTVNFSHKKYTKK